MHQRYYNWTDYIPGCFYTDFNAVKSALEVSESKNIIDMGCGNGTVVHALTELGYNAYGVDASEDGVEIANKKVPGKFFVCDVDTAKLPEELLKIQFDTVVSTQTIEHLYSPQIFLEFCYDLLPKGGVIIITTPYHGWLKNVMIALFNKFDDHVTALIEGGHIKFFSRKTITKLVSDNGFVVEDFKGMGRIPFLWKSMLIVARKQ